MYQRFSQQRHNGFKPVKKISAQNYTVLVLNILIGCSNNFCQAECSTPAKRKFTLGIFLYEIWPSGQSYKHFTLINYDSRVVPDWKIPHVTTLDS